MIIVCEEKMPTLEKKYFESDTEDDGDRGKVADVNVPAMTGVDKKGK